MMAVDSSPYRWPFDQSLDPATTALVVCGAGPEWASRTPIDSTCESNIASLRSLATTLSVPTFLIYHSRPNDRLPRALPEQPSPILSVGSDDVVIHAPGTDGFYGSPLAHTLRRSGRCNLLMVGHGFETAVHSTLRRGNDDGFECLVISDACACVDPRLGPASISSIEMSGGIFGAVATTAAVLAAFEPFVHQALETLP